MNIFFFLFFCIPQLYLWGSPFWVRFLRMWPFFNSTIEVVTFRLHGWCMLDEFLLPAFSHLGQCMNVRIFWVSAIECMWAQIRPWFILSFFFFLFFAFPSYISGVHHFWVRFLRMWLFFNPTFKVVTFLLRGWCVLGVFLLPAFTRLGHERQDLWVRAMKCMCAQTRPRFILSSERVFGGMEFEPMLTTGKCPQRRIEPVTLWTVSPSTTNWAIPAHILSFERAWGGGGGGGGEWGGGGGDGVRTHVNSMGKIPSTGKILLRGGLSPQH